MAYSVELKEKVISYLEAGHTYEEAQRIFKVGQATISKWHQRYRETGETKNVDLKKLKAYIVENPDATYKEITKVFDCSKYYVQIACKELGITIKQEPKLSPDKLKSYMEKHPYATLAETAEALGASVSTVLRVLSQSGVTRIVPPRKPRKLDPEQLRRYIKEHPDATLKEIGEEFECSGPNVLYALRKHNIPRSKPLPKLRTVDLEEFKEYVRANPDADIREISKGLGCSESTARRVFSRLGLIYKMPPQKSKKVDPKSLRDYMVKYPTATFEDIAKVYACSERTVYRAFKQLQKPSLEG